MLEHYVLNGHEPVLEPDAHRWVLWMELGDDRRVAETWIRNSRISTVFLGLDHNFSGDGAPVLFETMVFGGPMSEYTERYCTWGDALNGHTRIVERVMIAESGNIIHACPNQ